VQQGLDPNDWKPMPGVGAGAREIRIRTGLDHRVLYVATFVEAVYVIHAFEKKTRKTPGHDLQLARERFRALVTARRGTEHGQTT
jgi:phage-related protein